jgi:uncharacterized membrane protein
MKNRTVGFILLFVSLIIGVIIFLFNRALVDIVNTSCSHGPTCPMWGTIDFQTNISLILMLIVLAVALFLIFSKEEKVIITKFKKIPIEKEEKKKQNFDAIFKTLKAEEKQVFEKIISSGAILQSELINQTNFSKVKVSRILDKLEAKGLIERKRSGMSNLVVLKNN